MPMIHSSILDTIGNTPLLDLGEGLYAKAEYLNPSGSLKARMAHYLIERAEKEGMLKPGMTIVEATSGSTGNALSMVAAVKGYKFIMIMPAGYSDERVRISQRLGAEIRFVGNIQVNQAHEMALEMGRQDGFFCPQQFDTEWNVDGHDTWLGPEIAKQLESGPRIDAIVQGVGTGGTVIGVAKALRRLHNPDLKAFIIEPSESPTISRNIVGDHRIQGIADGWIPSIIERHKNEIDGYVEITSQDAISEAIRLTRAHGLFVGPSSGANVLAARAVQAQNSTITTVLTFLCDKGEKYLTEF